MRREMRAGSRQGAAGRRFCLLLTAACLLLTSCTSTPTALPTETRAPLASPTPRPATVTPLPAHTLTPTRVPIPSATPFNFAALTSGQWARLRGMPTARSETAAVQLEGLIYVPGGFVGSGVLWKSSKAFEVYDPLTNRWSQRASMPRALNHLLTTAHAGRIYVFSGLNDAGDPQPEAWVYDPAGDAWAALAPMPDWRVSGAAVSLGEYIYLVGGYGDPKKDDVISDVLRYDPAADQWSQAARLPHWRDHVAAVGYDGCLYLFGGRTESEDFASMLVYDPATDAWTEGPPMRESRAGHGVAVLNDLIYVAGGERISVFPEQIVATVEVYDPAHNRWVRVIDMPAGLHGLPVASAHGVLYLLGGSIKAADVLNNGTVWAYKP